MREFLWVGAGGALGSATRYAMIRWLGELAFPAATLAVNLSGSLLLGLLVGLVGGRVDVVIRTGLFIGLLGGFTTFSTFSVETISLFRDGDAFQAVGNVVVSVLGGLTVAWIGLIVGESLA